jgi:hypothetical protein
VKNWVKKLLGTSDTDAPKPSTVEPVVQASAQDSVYLASAELKLIHHDISHVLNQHENSRQVMRYVTLLEQALEKKGKRAIEYLPTDALRRAIDQLHSLGADLDVPGLSLLRSKAAISIAQRERMAIQKEHLRQEAEEEKIQVLEASHSEFLEANDQWEKSCTSPAELDSLTRKQGGGAKKDH